MVSSSLLVLTGSGSSYVFPTSDHTTLTLPSQFSSSSSSLKVHDKLRCMPPARRPLSSTTSITRRQAAAADPCCETSDGNWDNLGFNPLRTDFMYVSKCCGDDKFLDGDIQPYANVELNPASCVLNYGQGLIEGLKAYKKCDDSMLLFRLEENASRMRMGAEQLLMPAPTVEQCVEAVKMTVLANRRWVPPPNKGFLLIRLLLMGSGPVLSLGSAPEFTFLIYVTPVGNYFEGGSKPIDLLVENEVPRATPGGVGGVKAIGNYASIMKAQDIAKANGFSDVLYLDSVNRRYVEEVSTANIFVVKDNIISTPLLQGTILPGITRKSVIDIAKIQGFKVDERLVSVEELFEADEVFCTGNVVGLLPVGSITYLNRRVSFNESGLGIVSRQLHSMLVDIQMGLTEDKWGWTVQLK